MYAVKSFSRNSRYALSCPGSAPTMDAGWLSRNVWRLVNVHTPPHWKGALMSVSWRSNAPPNLIACDPRCQYTSSATEYLRWRMSKGFNWRSEEHTSELQSRLHLVCRLLLEKKKKDQY